MVMDGGHPLAVTNFHFLVFLIYELHVVAPSPVLPNHNISNAATFTRTAAPPNLWHVHWKRTLWCYRQLLLSIRVSKCPIASPKWLLRFFGYFWYYSGG